MNARAANLSAWGPRVRGLSRTYWALVALVVLCFALGGSARGDVVQLIALRPLSMLFLGYGLLTLEWQHVTAHKFLWAMACAVVALPALQLVPLPPQLWHQLPGHDLVVEIDRVAGLGEVWRPLTLTPVETMNALFASLVPFAGFVLGMQLTQEERFRLLPVVLVLGGLSAFLGLLQIVGDPQGPLYLFPNTNNGSVVGLFANRNHQAALLGMMLPMLCVMADMRGPGIRFATGLAGFLLLPLILITGSRSGLILAGLGLLTIPLWLSSPRPVRDSSIVRHLGKWYPSPGIMRLGIAAVGIALVALTIWLGRGEAWNRLFIGGTSEEARLQILPTLFGMIARYMPLGSGMGSFARVYLVHEPDALLDPTYMNNAHDDWLEVLLDGGVVAAALLFLASAAFILQVCRAWKANSAPRKQLLSARLGLVLVGLEGVASMSDYPLRTPAHAMLFVLAVLWAGSSLGEGSRVKTIGQTHDF